MINKVTARIRNDKPRIVLGLIMSMAMATALSFIITISYTGFSPNFLSIWVQRLVVSLTVGPPIALTILPFAMKLVGKIFRTP